MLLLWLGHAADMLDVLAAQLMYGCGRGNVVGLLPVLPVYFTFYFRNCSASEIGTLLTALLGISHKGTD